MAELPDVGKHCSLVECQQLDYLPVVCYGCMKSFCKAHHAYERHSCTKENQRKELPKFTGVKSYSCDLAGCSQTVLTPVICEHCSHNFCLQHRHQVDHQCAKYEPPKERMAQTKELVNTILETRTSKSDSGVGVKKTKGKGHKSKATAAKVALMKIKMSAVGDEGIPGYERIYIKVILPLNAANCKEKFKHVFFSDQWSIGKTVDNISNIVKLENRNNVSSAKKLRLFETDSGECMEFASNVGDCVKKGDFYSGSTLILEYVDDGICRLSNISDYSL